ncbi:MAG TPA: chaperone modulator CbpM [Candidatus Polarisedimenticolia bacterium]|nr:chaperone modulator CbpM [Candidatus Polarisedimenticolia bacterium]
MAPAFKVETRIPASVLADAAGISLSRLDALVRLGLIEAADDAGSEFTVDAVLKLRRMARLRADLGVNLSGAAVIVNLLDRLELMEEERGAF